MKAHVAKIELDINAPVEKVWDGLINPSIIKKYMGGSIVHSDWKPGSPITWKGEWEGRIYTDHGKILKFEPYHKLQYTHVSGNDKTKPEDFHTVNIVLSEKGNQTHLALEQDNNTNQESRSQAEQNWTMMFNGLKDILENPFVI
jgi:uncharacterized protein YndB with AHSA1/START domain